MPDMSQHFFGLEGVLNFGFIGWKSSKCSFNYIGKFGRVSKAAASVDYVLGLPAAVGIGVSGVPAIVGIGFRLWYRKSLRASVQIFIPIPNARVTSGSC